MAITGFGQLMINDPYIRSLPEEAQIHLAADVGDLAETTIPESLSEQEQEAVFEVIRESFVATFSILMWVGAAASAFSVFIAFFFINNRELEHSRGQDILDESDKLLV